MSTLRNRTIVLAGGSGGLGSHAARALSEEGARLVVSYRENLARAVALESVATLERADITQASDRSRLLDASPGIYGLVVFTGNPSRVTSSEEMVEALQISHDANYAGPLLLAREAAVRMRESGTPGAIVLLSTMQAVSLFPGSTAYAGAKAALIHGAQILAKECRGKTNVRVNVIAPGVMQAGMAEASIASGKYQRYLDENVIPRYGKAEDITRAVRFFLEPDNFVTGQVLSVDGGLTL